MKEFQRFSSLLEEGWMGYAGGKKTIKNPEIPIFSSF
jgi:hypothetical protein